MDINSLVQLHFENVEQLQNLTVNVTLAKAIDVYREAYAGLYITTFSDTNNLKVYYANPVF